MSSRGVIDLRRRKPGVATGGMRPLVFPEPKKRSTLRARRMRLRALLVLFLVMLAGGVAYGVSYVSYLPQFSVQGIEVKGAKDIRPSLVRTYVETIFYDGVYRPFSRTNIFLYPRAEIEQAIRGYFPRVERVHISRESFLATALVVSIQEREAFARWCASAESRFTGEGLESCYAMDKSGLIFAPVGAMTIAFATPYTFRGGLSATSTDPTGSLQAPVGQTYLPGRFAGVLALLDRLGQAGFAPHSVSAEGEQDFSVALAEGYELRATFGADIVGLVRDLGLVLSSEALRGKENELEYIDLRFGNRVYYKLFSEGESAFGGKGEEQQSAE